MRSGGSLMRRLRFLVAALLLACCPAGAGAAERSLVVGVEDLEYYPLYAIRDGEYVGCLLYTSRRG